MFIIIFYNNIFLYARFTFFIYIFRRTNKQPHAYFVAHGLHVFTLTTTILYFIGPIMRLLCFNGRYIEAIKLKIKTIRIYEVFFNNNNTLSRRIGQYSFENDR